MASAVAGANGDVARKGPDGKLLGRTAKTTTNRANSMATQLHRWLQRYARVEARRLQQRLATQGFVGFAKAELPTRREIELELYRILERGGGAAFISATRRTLGSAKAAPSSVAMAAFMRTKRLRLQQIMRSTERAVQESVRAIIVTAMDEVPRPSTNELGRRIARVYHGDTGGRIGDKVPAPLINPRVLPTQRVRLDDGGNLYEFGFARAQLIARTEMAQAENAGIVEGYTQAGITGLKWLAYRDGRSGDRRHDTMHGVVVPLGQPFVLPDGTRMQYPGDATAPIKHTANCRCTVAPARVLGA